MDAFEYLEPEDHSAKLRYYHDHYYKEPAWNIDPNYLGNEIILDLKELSVEIVESGPFRTVVCVTEILNRETKNIIKKFYIVRKGVPYLEISVRFDWNEPHFMVKMGFSPSDMIRKGSVLAIDSAYSLKTAQFKPSNPADVVRIEKTCQKFIDLSDTFKSGEINGEGYGLAVLTFDKYGFSHLDNQIQLTLLRTPEYPKPTAVEKFNWEVPEIEKKLGVEYPNSDVGYTFTRLGLFPHKGDWRSVVKISKEFNTDELYHLDTNIDQGSESNVLPNKLENGITISSDHVNIAAIKAPEDGTKGIVIRLYEMYGFPENKFTLSIPTEYAIERADVVNILEQKNGGGDLHSGESVGKINRDIKILDSTNDGAILSLGINPFEIRTLKIVFR